MTYREEDIKDLVRHILLKTLRSKENSGRKAVTAEEITALEPGSTLAVEAGTLITPMARETAMARHITLQETQAGPAATAAMRKTVAIGADHGGFEIKEMLKPYIKELGFEPLDMGTHSKEAVDYPDIAYAVAEQVANGAAFRGIVIDAAGIGSCMAANKVPGVRAAMCYDEATAVNSRKHNDANVLSLGSGLLGPTLIKQIVKTWLTGEFEGGRHQKRIDKIIAIERRYSKV
jgi:ribose 5-phosphate isomerase B